MTDRDHIAALLKLAGDASSLQAAQQSAAKKLLHMDGEHYPSDGCAITQSCLLEAAGIVIPDTYLAIAFGAMLEKRGWERIAVGKQQAGDIGSTCKAEPDHGNDHVFLCLRPINDDEMVIADNQAHVPHMRYASGKGGKTPTTHFLRAPADVVDQAERPKVAAPAPVKPPLSPKAASFLTELMELLSKHLSESA